jgi:hypothetical protein
MQPRCRLGHLHRICDVRIKSAAPPPPPLFAGAAAIPSYCPPRGSRLQRELPGGVI